MSSSGFGQPIKGSKNDSGAAKRKRKKNDVLLTASMQGAMHRHLIPVVSAENSVLTSINSGSNIDRPTPTHVDGDSESNFEIDAKEALIDILNRIDEELSDIVHDRDQEETRNTMKQAVSNLA